MPVFDDLPVVMPVKSVEDAPPGRPGAAETGEEDAVEPEPPAAPEPLDEQPIDEGSVEAPTEAATGKPQAEAASEEPQATIAVVQAPPEPSPAHGGGDAAAEHASSPTLPRSEEIWDDLNRPTEARVRPPRETVKPGQLPQRRVVVIDESGDIDVPGLEPPPINGAVVATSGSIGATLEDEAPEPKRRWRLFRKGGE
jgi:hypothetical protein